jgi:DNA-binding NarL/FixJ family response regulator
MPSAASRSHARPVRAQLFPVLVPLLGWLRGMSGRLAESAELVDGAIEAARLAENTQALAWALFCRAMTALHAGEEYAVSLAQESADLTDAPGGSMLGSFAGLVLGHTLVESGSHEPGVELMIARTGGADLPLVGGVWKAYFLDWLTSGLLAAGRRTEAERAAAGAEAVAETTGLRLAAFAAGRARARVTLASGAAAAAAERARAAAAGADELGAPIEAALSRIVAGRALAAAGEREPALAELTSAATALDAIGAPRYRAAAESELSRLGQRPQRRSRPGTAGGGVESLSQREREVARLIVDRRTNPQIAAELFLSQKTVETHVRNLFHKLGVSSRAEVARTIERAERSARSQG